MQHKFSCKATMPKQKAIFLDRDGVLNKERGEYTFKPEEFEVIAGVPEALKLLKNAGFKLIIITNQGGIAKGLYTKQDVLACHHKLQQECGNLIDFMYMAPGHPDFTESLSRKPDSLMLEKAIAKFDLDPTQSWMIGDKPRDMEAAAKVGVNGILVNYKADGRFPVRAADLLEAAKLIVNRN